QMRARRRAGCEPGSVAGCSPRSLAATGDGNLVVVLEEPALLAAPPGFTREGAAPLIALAHGALHGRRDVSRIGAAARLARAVRPRYPPRRACGNGHPEGPLEHLGHLS